MADKNFKVKTGLDLPAPLPVSQGGTGQTSTTNTLNSLLPSQPGNSSKFLTTDGTTVSWATPTLTTSFDGGGAFTVYTGGINAGGAS